MSDARLISCWSWPLLLAFASVAGLVVALVADGRADLLSAAALAAPLAVAGWHILRTRRGS